MVNWLRKLFGMADRTEKAADRMSETMEGIADDLQPVRRARRRRLGLEDAPSTSASVPVIEDRTEADVPTHRGNGRKAKAVAS